jgi:hypothetical protein
VRQPVGRRHQLFDRRAVASADQFQDRSSSPALARLLGGGGLLTRLRLLGRLGGAGRILGQRARGVAASGASSATLVSTGCCFLVVAFFAVCLRLFVIASFSFGVALDCVERMDMKRGLCAA